jgi:hypothetical protein
VLTNRFEEPLFVLFQCAHPRADGGQGPGLVVSGLRLQASSPGVEENLKDAWLWSGMIAPLSAVTVNIGYRAGSLRGVTYRVRESQGDPVQHVRVTLQRQDLDSMRCESGDGANITAGDKATSSSR